MLTDMEVDELYWSVVAHTADVLNIFITGAFFYRFVKPFMPGNRRTGYVAVAFAGIMLILLFMPFEISGALAYAIGVVGVFIAMYLIDKRNVEQKIFLALICYLLEWISWGALVAIWNTLIDFSLTLSVVRGDYLLQFVFYLIYQIVWLITEVFIYKFLIRILHGAYIYKTENMTKKELALMLAPLSSLIVGRWVFRYFVNVYEADLKRYIWDDHHSYNLLLALYQIISFAAMFTVITIYQSIKESQRREKEETVLAKQIEDMERHINEVEKLYHDIRSLKHDMRSHVMVLENLCGENEEAGRYVTQLKEEIDESILSVAVGSGNPITDIIISQMQKEAEEKKLGFECSFRYPESTKLNIFDVSVILNNAVRNAIEAAVECSGGYVSITSYRKNNAYMIEIRNSITGKRLINEDSGLPVSTKEGANHGLGLFNIRKMSQKYYGDIAIEQTEEEFTLVIMLMIE